MASAKTGIEWTDKTWNPVTGCHKVSPGCANCYAEAVTRRFGINGGKFDEVVLHFDRLNQPLRWRNPSRIFVNSMSDLFHKDVPDDFIDEVFAVMALSPKHTFQILTKRPERMLAYLKGTCQWGIANYVDEISGEPFAHSKIKWPIPNVWLGVSVESQAYVNRIDLLRQCPAAVRFISCEPLLGPLELDLTGIHWVIVGGESGAGCRPIKPEWVQSIRDQCQSAGVAFFFKQWGGTTPKKNGNLLNGEQFLEFPKASDMIKVAG